MLIILFIFRNYGRVVKRNDFVEILIPEFCIWHKFPPVYWVKALMLPTILHRLHNLLNANDLIKLIDLNCNFNESQSKNCKHICL